MLIQNSNTHKSFALYCTQTKLLTQEQCSDVLAEAKKNQLSFISALVQTPSVSSELVAKTIAEFFNLPYFDFSEFQYRLSEKNILKLSIVQQQQAIPVEETHDTLCIAVYDPTLSSLKHLNFLTGKKTRLVIAEAQKIRDSLETISQQDLNQILQNLPSSDLESLALNNLSKLTDSRLNAPVVQFIDKILHDAIHQKASDIHFEPYEDQYRIRFRRDGILSTVAEPPLKLAPVITARLKILANLDISERRIPQDGRFNYRLSTQKIVDFRMSSCPTLEGERMVLRLLDAKTNHLAIESLGMTESQQKLFLDRLNRSQGMILATGPTGSGKTTSLYSGINYLNTRDKNISTVEDPVEIQLAGINQVHINLKTGLTFAVALRAFLRQDPDILMVGEIRDLETAEIAISASQTGHLVLSTLHTNSAVETLLRLGNMGIPVYNIASSVSLIIAQRLVRSLCQHCKKPETIPRYSLIEAGFKEAEIAHLKLYTAAQGHCQYCENGYQGRIAIFEVLPISEKMAALMMEGSNALILNQQAKRENIPSLQESGLEKVRSGQTSLSEINRHCRG